MKRNFGNVIVAVSLILSLAWSNAGAQVTARVEYPYDGDYTGRCMIPLDDIGAMSVAFSKHSKGGKNIFMEDFYSTDLKLLKTDSLAVDRQLDYYDNVLKDGVNYSLLTSKRGAYGVVAFDTRSRQSRMVSGQFKVKNWSLEYPKVDEDRLVFCSTEGKRGRGKDHVGIINLLTGEGRMVDIRFKGLRPHDVELLESTIIDGKIQVMVKAKEDIYLVRLDMDGRELERLCLTENLDEHILTASVSKAGSALFVTGTYAKRERRGAANGIFFARLGREHFDFIRFYNFLDLTNFTGYMSDRKKAKVERRKAKAEKNDKEMFLDYLLTSHDIIEQGDCYYYLGEAYYPTYSTMYNGRSAYTVFSGYAYTHAVIVKFDRQGNRLWDCCFPMKPSEKPYYVKHFVTMSLSPSGQILCLYGDGKQLVSKIFSDSDGSVVKDRQKELLETDDDREDVKKAGLTNTLHWYDNNFMVFGNQVVKNHATGERRRVIYINKYTME